MNERARLEEEKRRERNGEMEERRREGEHTQI
jgi:hypothetical protein